MQKKALLLDHVRLQKMAKISDFKFIYKFKNSTTLFCEFADDESELLRKINKRYSKTSEFTFDDIEIIEKSILF